jgi:plasmid stabilization system protein ParE
MAADHAATRAFPRDEPLRYEVIPEALDIDLEQEYRHVLSGTFRIVYRVEPSRVVIVRVIRSARLLTESMLQEPGPP